MRNYLYTLSVSVPCAFLPAGLCPARNEPVQSEEKVQFLSEAPRQWLQYREFAKRLQGSIRDYQTNPVDQHGRTVTVSSTREFVQNRRNAFFSFDPISSGNQKPVVELSTTQYDARLGRKVRDAPWVLEAFDLRAIDPEQKTKAHQLIERFTCLHFTVMGVRLSDLVAKPNFNVLSIDPVREGGKRLFQVKFERPHSIDERPFDMVQSGVIVFDSGNYWCVNSCEINIKGRDNKVGLHRAQFEYRASPSGFPILSKAQIGLKTLSSTTPEATQVMDFDLHEPSELPSDEVISLSHFGLPEPIGVIAPREYPNHIWYLLTGVLALTFAIVIKARARRRSLPPAS